MTSGTGSCHASPNGMQGRLERPGRKRNMGCNKARLEGENLMLRYLGEIHPIVK